jgi:hypothetical protein
MNPLTIFQPKHKRNQDLKERVLKNKEAVLDVMASNIQGAKQCEALMGAKCLGQFCEKFLEFKTKNDATGKETSYWRCAHIQTPLLIIELIQNVRETNRLLTELIKKGG